MEQENPFGFSFEILEFSIRVMTRSKPYVSNFKHRGYRSSESTSENSFLRKEVGRFEVGKPGTLPLASI